MMLNLLLIALFAFVLTCQGAQYASCGGDCSQYPCGGREGDNSRGCPACMLVHGTIGTYVCSSVSEAAKRAANTCGADCSKGPQVCGGSCPACGLVHGTIGTYVCGSVSATASNSTYAIKPSDSKATNMCGADCSTQPCGGSCPACMLVHGTIGTYVCSSVSDAAKMVSNTCGADCSKGPQVCGGSCPACGLVHGTIGTYVCGSVSEF